MIGPGLNFVDSKRLIILRKYIVNHNHEILNFSVSSTQNEMDLQKKRQVTKHFLNFLLKS